MRTSDVAAVDAPREFALEEMFFSTTDRKGVIQSGNSVFVRVSAYTADELIGRPHNTIRHPDMPRAAFRLLWRQLIAGHPFVAYVKNLAKDGRYYWVVAFIMPEDGGYLSIRFKPSSELLRTVEGIYTRMRAVEREHGDGGEAGRAGMDAAEKLLLAELQSLGFASYEAFMWTLMHKEMQSRDAALRARPAEALADTDASASARRLRAIHASGERAAAQIERLYQQLDQLAVFSAELVRKSTFVTELTREIRFVALSTSLESTRLGDVGNSLAVIARFLDDTSLQTAHDVARLTARIRDISAELQAVSFDLSGARLQLEMLLIFCRELLHGEGCAGGGGQAGMVMDLKKAFSGTAATALKELNLLRVHLHELDNEADCLRKTVLMLQVAQVSGLVETSRIHRESSVGAIFEDVRTYVARASEELGGLREITHGFSDLVRSTPEIQNAVGEATAEMDEQLAGFESDVAKT